MATKTSAQSGLWSATTTWVGGVVPADGDIVIIATGHVIDFDVDMSGWTQGITDMTHRGTLRFLNDGPDVQYLKISTTKDYEGFYGYPGIVMIGTPENPFPRTKRATIYSNGHAELCFDNFYVYGELPARIETTLAADAAVNATTIVLTEDLDLRAGDEILIHCSTTTGTWQIPLDTLKTVSAYDSATKTVTLTAGLTYARAAGDVCIGFNAPIHFEYPTYDGDTQYDLICCGASVFRGVYMKNVHRAIMPWEPATVSYVFANNSMITSVTDGAVIDHCYLTGPNSCACELGAGGTIISDSVMINGDSISKGGWGTSVKDSRIYNGGCFLNSTDNFLQMTIGGSVYNCDVIDSKSTEFAFAAAGIGVYNSRVLRHAGYSAADTGGGWATRNTTDFIFKNCTFTGNFNDISGWTSNGAFYDCELIGTTGEMVASSNNATFYPSDFHVEFFNWNHVEGAYESYGLGGKMYLQSTTKYNGQNTLRVDHYDNEGFDVWRDFPVVVPANKTVNFHIAAMKTYVGADKVKLQIIDPSFDPIKLTSATPLAEVSMPDITNEWAEFGVSYKSELPKLIKVRILAHSTTGSTYFYTVPIEQALGEDRENDGE